MDLYSRLEGLATQLEQKLNGLGEKVQANIEEDLENIRVEYLGRKGQVAEIMSHLPELSVEERPKLGQLANLVKTRLTSLVDERKQAIAAQKELAKLSNFDPSLPSRLSAQGSLHPITQVMDEVCAIFTKLGYEIASGPEIETDFYNFEALNLPQNHPARDMQDTFYVEENKYVLRTHTSPIQARTMIGQKPPVAIIAPGKVYRKDSDITHTPMFHQIEGLYVDKKVSMADLRGTLTLFMRTVFGKDTKVRFRPSFFPFTEPSAEADISCTACKGTGKIGIDPCRICKGTGWLEILGCGMVHTAVFEKVGYDPEGVTGFAFGLGLERTAMLKYGINDIRLNFENDLRYLQQFGQ